MFSLFLLVESSSEISELIACLKLVVSTIPFRFWLEMQIKFSNSMNSLFSNLILPKLEVGQNFWCEIHVQKAISLSILDEFRQMRAQNLG